MEWHGVTRQHPSLCSPHRASHRISLLICVLGSGGGVCNNIGRPPMNPVCDRADGKGNINARSWYAFFISFMIWPRQLSFVALVSSRISIRFVSA